MMRFVFVVVVVVLASRLAAAECSSSSQETHVVGVAADGRFVVSESSMDEDQEHKGPTLTVVNADGTGQRASNTKLDTTPLQPSTLPMRLINMPDTLSIMSGKSTLYVVASLERPWHAALFEHPSSPLVFIRLTAHSKRARGCETNIERVVWVPRTRLQADEPSAALEYCNSEAVVKNDDNHLKQLGCWASILDDKRFAAELVRAADNLDPRAIASVTESSSFGALLLLAKTENSKVRALALSSLTIALNNLRSPGRDLSSAQTIRRLDLIKALPPLCATSKNGKAELANAEAACRDELAVAAAGNPVRPEKCETTSCASELVGVGPQGDFVVAKREGWQYKFELYLPDGHARARYTLRCEKPQSCDQWLYTGELDRSLLALGKKERTPASLRAALTKALKLDAAFTPSTVKVHDAAASVRVGHRWLADMPVATATLRAFDHPNSKLTFVELTSTTCEKTPCRFHVWGPRSDVDPNDTTALVASCEHQPSADEQARCLSTIADDSAIKTLLDHGKRADERRWIEAAAYVAARTSPRALLALTTSNDAFDRQWALYSLAALIGELHLDKPRLAPLIEVIGPACLHNANDPDPLVAGAAITCLGRTELTPNPKRVLELLRDPRAKIRESAFMLARYNNMITAAEDVRYVGSWLGEPIDAQREMEQEDLHYWVCFVLDQSLGVADEWARPLLEARIKTLRGSGAREVCTSALQKLSPTK